MLDAIGRAADHTGLVNGVGGFTWSKADALLKSVGANIDEFLPSATVAGRTMGIVGGTFSGVGIVASGIKLYVGVIEDGSGWTWDDDGWDSVQLGLAVTGGALALAGGGIAIAVASLVVGGVSIGLSMYTMKQEIQNKQQLRSSLCNI